MSNELFAIGDAGPLLGAYVVPSKHDRKSAVASAEAMQHAGVDFAVTATSGPERSRYTSTNQAIDLAATCQSSAHLPTLATVTTWSRSVLALQAHLLGGHARGITRLVCGNGSAPNDSTAGAGGRWAVDVVELIELLNGLNEGIDRHGLPLERPTRFEIGVRIRAVPELAAADRARTRRKIDAGAHFIVSSPVYHQASLEPLLEVVDGDVPVLATVHPLRSVAEARALRQELPAGCIPMDLVRRLESASSASDEAAAAAVEVTEQISPAVKGVILTRSDDTRLAGAVRQTLSGQRLT